MEPLSLSDPTAAVATLRDLSEAVLATLPLGVVVEGPGGDALTCNRSAELLLGLTREQLRGEQPVDPRWSTIHEDGWPLPPDARPGRVAARTRRPCTGTTLGVKKPDGSVTWVAVDAHPLFEDDASEPYGVAVTYADVTGSRRAAAELSRDSERFRSLIEYSSDVITILDEQGRQTYESPAIERVLGHAPGDLAGASRISQVHPEDVSAVLAAFAGVLGRPGASASVEYRIRARDGSWRIVESVAANRLHDPAVLGIVVNTRDLTERRREQAALRATTSRLTNLVHNIEAGVLVEDEERRVELVNSDFCAIFGIDATPAALVGADCSAGLGEAASLLADPAAFRRRVDAVVAARAPVLAEEVSFADGRTFERDYIPISADGSDRGNLWLYRDISERKRAEAEAARARDEAIRASRLKSEFLATMSHEIRTPMNGVIGTAELLLDSPLSPDQRELTEVVRSSARELLALLDDVLDLSRIEAERLEAKEADFELAPLLEGVADVLIPAARRKGLALVAFADPRVSGTLRGDAQWLRQVLVNLLGNAVKFTDSGEVEMRAVLERRTDRADVVRFSVTDSGPGIPAGARERLFEPFTQLDSGTTRRHGGSGLGLAICQRLVRLMGGEVEVDSEPGAGSAFAFTLSFARASGDGAAAPPAGVRVLLAEPCDSASRVIDEYLSAWGVVRERATSGAEARRLAAGAAASGRPFSVAIVGAGLDEEPAAVARDLRAAGDGAMSLLLLDDGGGDEGGPPDPFAARLRTPVKQARLLDAIAGRAQAAADRPEPSRRHQPEELRGARVLVADDNAVNRELMLRQLQKLGIAADAVEAGSDAVQAAARERYDAVLMDCRMPDVDGLQAARAILASGRRTPVLAVTASATPEAIEACRSAGMATCLTKPFSTDELADALLSVLPRGASEEDAVDLATLDRLGEEVGDARGVHKIARAYLAGLPRVREELADALARGDRDGLRMAAHGLRASSATFGARALARLSARLEAAPEDGAEQLVARIAGESVRVETQLGEALARYGSSR